MNIPGFTADRSLRPARGRYRNSRFAAQQHSGDVIPALPRCENCDYILENCERNNWRPRALCAACALGNCWDEPPMPNPYPDPFPPLPRF
jgi:hypothetical protein